MASVGTIDSIKDRLIILKEPNSIVAESYRTLRATLSRSLAKGKKHFIVVSAWGGDGKSMVSANLAVALSQLLMDVVLVDGDLRRPTISRVFEKEGAPGLLNILETGDNPQNYLCATGLDRLSLLPAGRSSANPGDLLGAGGFSKIFQAPCIAERCVIVDTSPLSACSDALLMGASTDGAVMVVSPSNWQGEPEAHFAQDLEDHGIEILGAVLNGANPAEMGPGGGYGYGSSYGYSYGYGQELSEPQKKKGILAKILRTKK